MKNQGFTASASGHLESAESKDTGQIRDKEVNEVNTTEGKGAEPFVPTRNASLDCTSSLAPEFKVGSDLLHSEENKCLRYMVRGVHIACSGE